MGSMSRHIPISVKLPDGSVLSLSDLPPSADCRWTAKRKAAVVLAVEHGLIQMDEAMFRYALSGRELTNWIAAFSERGTQALRVRPLKSKPGTDDTE